MSQTNDSVVSVLESLGVKHVIQVDDANAKFIELERVLEAGASFSSWDDWSILGVPVPVPEVPFTFWRKAVRTHWESLDENEQQEFALSVLRGSGSLDGDTSANDESIQGVLKKMFRGVLFQTLSLGEWESQSEKVIAAAKHEPTLVLFDLHFERESKEERYGVRLLERHKGDEDLILGLLSHQPDLKDEPILWQSIGDEIKMPLSRFVVLSKKRISSDDESLFVDGLRRTILARDVSAVRELCSSILHESVSKASELINSISIYDFDQAIFRSSRIEGVWEGDTFFRLFSASVRQCAQQAMHGSMELQHSITSIRQKFPVKKTVDGTVQRNVWELQRKEIYEDVDFVNKHLLPISNGDIFQITPSSEEGKVRTLVLVSQPCDLAVRSDGKRGADKKCSRMGFWLEATEAKNSQALRRTEFQLPYFEEGKSQPWLLKLGRIQYVLLSALDLCALNSNGCARLKLDEGIDEPLLLPGWSKRAKLLQKVYRQSIDVIPSNVKFEQHDKQKLVEAVVPSPCQSLDIKVSIEERAPSKRILTFGIERIGRISSEWSASILGQVTAHLSRPAFEHDLTRDK